MALTEGPPNKRGRGNEDTDDMMRSARAVGQGNQSALHSLVEEKLGGDVNYRLPFPDRVENHVEIRINDTPDGAHEFQPE